MFFAKQPSHRRAEPLEDLVMKASTASQIPPPPKRGIPKQWVPGWIRWPIRALFLPFILLDLWSQKVARWVIKPPYIKEGMCQMRGNCCHYVLLEKPSGPISYLFYFWMTQINGFFQRDIEPVQHEKHTMLVMGCRYLKEDGRCGHHFLRPMLCRQWPLIEYFSTPKILKGCGFRAVPRTPPKDKLKVLK